MWPFSKKQKYKAVQIRYYDEEKAKKEKKGNDPTIIFGQNVFSDLKRVYVKDIPSAKYLEKNKISEPLEFIEAPYVCPYCSKHLERDYLLRQLICKCGFYIIEEEIKYGYRRKDNVQ